MWDKSLYTIMTGANQLVITSTNAVHEFFLGCCLNIKIVTKLLIYNANT